MTVNPNRPEIKRLLEHNQSSDTRPDLIAIVFKLKFDAVLHDAKNRHIFGRIIGYTFSIEYQERGLPHVLILLYLHGDDVPKTPEQIDELVRAQIPTYDPVLAEIIKSQLCCAGNWTKEYCDTTN
ncbi:hypothetical protein EPUL_005462, partial [Erysiphe pulchra]